MITVSLCMIVKNEEDCLARCLDSVGNIFDEIIIVDTGSSDGTVDIAKKYTDKVYQFDWTDDFSAARNFSFSKATMEYCMWLDADDVLLEDDAQLLTKLKDELSKDTDIVMMRYNTAFDEFGRALFVYYRERIIKNDLIHLWQGKIHEAIVPFGKIIYSDAAVTHKKEKEKDPDRNLRIFEKMISDKEILSPREKFYYARELFYHEQYDKAISVFNDFLSSDEAWTENKIDACRVLADCYLAKDDIPSAVSALSFSLTLDSPRAEICCKLGEIMINNENYAEAIHWFLTALSQTPKPESGAFVLPDCYGYIPAIWLCVCFWHTGNYKKAYEYNESALSFKPNSEAGLSNKKLFEEKGLLADK